MRAYLLMKVSPPYTMDMMHALRENPHILEASIIHGPYDCLAVVQGKDLEEINQAVWDIRQMEGVMETSTHLIVQFWVRSQS